MTRLPKPGADDGQWGSVLNDFLEVEHNADGSLKNVARPSDLSAKYTLPSSGIPESDLASAVQTKLNNGGTIADGSITSAKIASEGLVPSAITGTAVVTSDTRLSNQRIPTDGSVTDAKVASGGLTNAALSSAAGITAGQLASGVQASLGKADKAFIQVAAPSGVATTDTANIVAALTAASTAGGGIVYLQAGGYEITVGQISIPANTVLAGSGMGVTWLHKRAAGIAVDASGTNETTGRKLYAQVRDLSVHGHDNTGPAIRQYHISQGHLQNVGISFNNDVALDIVDAWDTSYYNIFLDWSGSYNGTNPALWVRNSAHASDPLQGFNATAQTNMVRFYGMRIESFRFGAKIERGAGSSIDPYFISFDGIKFETAYVRGRYLYVQNARAVHLRDIDMTADSFDTGVSSGINPIFWAPIGESSIVNLRFYQVSNVFFVKGIEAYIPTGGAHLFDSISFENASPFTSIIDFNSNNPATVRNVYCSTVSKRFSFTSPATQYPMFPTVASAATITIPLACQAVNVTGSTGITAIAAGDPGQTVTLYFAGAVTLTAGSSLKLAGAANFTSTADDTLTLLYTGNAWVEISRSIN